MADDQDDEQSVRVHTDLVDDRYHLVITFDDDNVLHLEPSALVDWCTALSMGLLRAQYAEGIRRQMRARGMTDLRAATVAMGWRSGLLDLPTFPPYEIRPCVSVEGRTSVQVWRGDKIVVQFAQINVQEHIYQCLGGITSMSHDTAYHDYLTREMGWSESAARKLITGLADYLDYS